MTYNVPGIVLRLHQTDYYYHPILQRDTAGSILYHTWDFCLPCPALPLCLSNPPALLELKDIKEPGIPEGLKAALAPGEGGPGPLPLWEVLCVLGRKGWAVVNLGFHEPQSRENSITAPCGQIPTALPRSASDQSSCVVQGMRGLSGGKRTDFRGSGMSA